MEEKVILTQQELEKVSGGAGNDGTYSYAHLYNAIQDKLDHCDLTDEQKREVDGKASLCSSYFYTKSTHFNKNFDELKQLLDKYGLLDTNIQTLIDGVVF